MKRGVNPSRSPKRRPLDTVIEPNNLATCDQAITPACIKALYQIPPATKAHPENSMGIFEEGDYYSQKDLNLFFTNLSLGIPEGTHPVPAFIDGAHAPVSPKDAGGESDLDFELTYPIIYPQTITLYQTDDFNYAYGETYTAGFLNTFLDALDGVCSPFIQTKTNSNTVPCSHTALTAPLANVETIQCSTLSIQIQRQVDIRES